MSRPLTSENDYNTYTCGRCKGKILYVKKKPSICPECGWGWQEKNVKDIHFPVRLNIFGSFTQAGSRGKTEQTTISSR